MRTIISIALIIGFLFLDFLFFHDIFKPGEITTLPQYITGVLSIPAVIFSFESLLSNHRRPKSQ